MPGFSRCFLPITELFPAEESTYLLIPSKRRSATSPVVGWSPVQTASQPSLRRQRFDVCSKFLILDCDHRWPFFVLSDTSDCELAGVLNHSVQTSDCATILFSGSQKNDGVWLPCSLWKWCRCRTSAIDPRFRVLFCDLALRSCFYCCKLQGKIESISAPNGPFANLLFATVSGLFVPEG